MAIARGVLIVEDDPAIREILTVAIGEELGVPVTVARDGAEAIERAEKTLPAVVVLDLMLPETDGFEVSRRLRAARGTAGAYILAISAAGQAMGSAALNAGADAFLPKPFELEELVGRVGGALRSANRGEGDGRVIRFPGSA